MTAPSLTNAVYKVDRGCKDGVNPQLVWLHGWGHTHQNLLGLANLFENDFHSTLFDLPGFGDTTPLESGADTGRYAQWLSQQLLGKDSAVLVGHSFGCRVALTFASCFPEKVLALVLIAAPGLPRRRSVAWRLKAFFLKTLGRSAALCDRVLATHLKTRFRNRFGSSDYRSAGMLRDTLVRVVNEDLTETARRVKAPVLLIYGAEDQDTPSDLGMRFQTLLPKSQLIVLPKLDHYSVLLEGKFLLETRIRKFIQSCLNP